MHERQSLPLQFHEGEQSTCLPNPSGAVAGASPVLPTDSGGTVFAPTRVNSCQHETWRPETLNPET